MTTHNSTTLHDFLAQLDNHDWYYCYSSDHSVYTRGHQNEKRLIAIAESSPPHSILYKAYIAYRNGSESKPTEPTTTPTPKSTYNLKDVMAEAWVIARKAARKFGDKPATFISIALKQAWAKTKAAALNTATSKETPKTAFYICIDEKTGYNTRKLNTPVVEQVFLKRSQATAALELLKQAFHRPFIKESSHFNLQANITH